MRKPKQEPKVEPKIEPVNGIQFKSLMIKNGRVWDDVAIPLDNQGLVSIQGDNGVGKSSIWDILEAVIYGSTPDGFKKDELTKNDGDAEYKLVMEKNGETIVATLQRKGKKWSYDIKKNNTPYTDHTYYDAIKTLIDHVGLTKDEFEGSVHLTQNAQHMLIKGTLSERKDYISAFFGIDNRYDEVHIAAKAELGKVSENIQRLSALSHSEQMLQTEINNLTVHDLEPLQNKLNTLQKSYNDNIVKLTKIDEDLNQWKEYERHIVTASFSDAPEAKLTDIEAEITEIQTKINYNSYMHQQNKQAQVNNERIDTLEFELASLENLEVLKGDTTPISEYETELLDLQSIRKQNIAVETLRIELSNLPALKALPIERIESELVNLQVAYQTHLKNKQAKEKGICPECGSQFSKQDVQKEIENLKEIKATLDLLNQDYATIKTRNQNANRRCWVMEQLKSIPEFLEAHENRISFLQRYIPLKRKYEELCNNLKHYSRMPLVAIEDLSDLQVKVQELKVEQQKYQECMLAKKVIPLPPTEKEDKLTKKKTDLHNQLLNISNMTKSTHQMIGEWRVANETYERLEKQLKDIQDKLKNLDVLKKEEYFWDKVVDAYGPKGLRVQQLERMMDLIIKQLPVYVSILFKEKNLTFTHKVDANNVRIIANREVLNDNGDVINTFQHDIGCFSGGEKDKMSAAFILTLADCIPQHKRANILVLDEVDAQLDKDGKFRFTNDLLPMLKKKYSSIFVISHDRDVQLANVYDQVWSISKNNHSSELTILN